MHKYSYLRQFCLILFFFLLQYEAIIAEFINFLQFQTIIYYPYLSREYGSQPHMTSVKSVIDAVNQFVGCSDVIFNAV